VDDVELPRAPNYTEIRYLTTDEVWALVDAVRPVADNGTDGMTYEALDRAMYLTAAMTGLGVGELQALEAAFARRAEPCTSLRRLIETERNSEQRTRGHTPDRQRRPGFESHPPSLMKLLRACPHARGAVPSRRCGARERVCAARGGVERRGACSARRCSAP
jgi:hypothetical protein